MEAINANNVSVALYRPQPGTKAVAIRRGMLQIPAVMKSLEPVERAVFIASTDRTIEEYAAQELAAELAKALGWIAKDIGYRATDSADWNYTIVRIAEILKRYYPNFTIKDFRMAFEMSVTGELNDYLPKGRDGQPDNNHYQQFNAEYVCKILNAYKMRRAAVLKKANDAVPKPEQERNPERERYYRNQTRREIIATVLHYKYRGYMPRLSPIGEMLVYDGLANVGLAEPVNVTEQEQRAIFERTLFELSQQQRIGEMNELKRTGHRAEQLQSSAFQLARRKALKAAIESIVNDEIQITDYIKFEK